MNHRAVPSFLAVVLVALGAGIAMAGDIVTVPTANQVKAGEIDVADYYIFVDQDALIDPLQPLDIDFVDVHRYDVDVAGVNTIFNATYLVLEEDAQRPNVVLGGRDLSNEYGHASYFVSAAKTLNPPIAGPPTEPIIRLHLSLGTEDNTLFGEGRHEGLFGGVQILLRPSEPAVGLVALYDGQDIITGLTFVPKPGWPTLKGGTFGGHWWVGASYTFNAK